MTMDNRHTSFLTYTTSRHVRGVDFCVLTHTNVHLHMSIDNRPCSYMGVCQNVCQNTRQNVSKYAPKRAKTCQNEQFPVLHIFGNMTAKSVCFLGSLKNKDLFESLKMYIVNGQASRKSLRGGELTHRFERRNNDFLCSFYALCAKSPKPRFNFSEIATRSVCKKVNIFITTLNSLLHSDIGRLTIDHGQTSLNVYPYTESICNFKKSLLEKCKKYLLTQKGFTAKFCILMQKHHIFINSCLKICYILTLFDVMFKTTSVTLYAVRTCDQFSTKFGLCNLFCHKELTKLNINAYRSMHMRSKKRGKHTLFADNICENPLLMHIVLHIFQNVTARKLSPFYRKT